MRLIIFMTTAEMSLKMSLKRTKTKNIPMKVTSIQTVLTALRGMGKKEKKKKKKKKKKRKKKKV